MLKNIYSVAFLMLVVISGNAAPFMGGMPGIVQMQFILKQRHQAKALLYRKAIEELRRNPKVADIPECTRNMVDTSQCLPIKKVETIPPTVANQPIAYRRALLIGNQLYRDPKIPKLNTPGADVDTVATKLQQHFDFDNVRLLKDATKADTVAAMANLATEVQPTDSVFIFYAGHGYLMDDTGMGYWIPIDGLSTTAKNWISNQDISKFIHAIAAKQIILISDSCFSGTLTKESEVVSLAIEPVEILTKRSVIAFSSGGDEPVSDEGRDGHSVFAWHFSNELDKLQGTTLGYNLFIKVKSGVIKDYPQTPQYGAIISAGHQPGGDYIFQSSD